MPTIHINVKNRVATANGDSRIINGNSDYSIEFDFDAEWADLNNKIGIFAYNDAATHKWAYQTVLFSGNTCTVPILRDIHCVYVGVTAGNVRVTTPAKVQCRLSISDYADTEEPPSADIWGQILAKLDELQTEIDEIKAGGVGGTDISLGVTGATVGQTVNVKAVDADGKPTAWEAVDMGAAGAEVYYAELDGEYPSYTLSAETPLADIAKAYEANKSIVCRCKIGGKTATLPLFIPMPKTNTWFFSSSGALGERYPAQTFTVAITPFGVEAEQTRIAAQTALDAVTITANEAVRYTPQRLDNLQKQQAQKNIGINPEDRTTSMTNPVGVDGYGKLWSKADTSLNVTGATVGQTIKVKAVDTDGKPTAWEAVDMAAGDTEVWEELTHFVGTADSPVNSVKQTFPAGAYKKIYIVGHIVLSGTNNPAIYIDSNISGVPKVFANQAISGTFRVLIEAFGTGVAVYRSGRTPDNQFAWNGGWDATTRNDMQMSNLEFVEVFSGHKNTTFAEGTDFTIYGVKA